MDEIIYSTSPINKDIDFECEKCHATMNNYPTFLLHVNKKHKLPIILKCKNCHKATVQHRTEEKYFKTHRCYIFNNQVAGSNPGQQPAQLESIQEVYIPVSDSAANQEQVTSSSTSSTSMQQMTTTIVNKRTSLTPPPTYSTKKLKTAVEPNTAISELIEIE